MTDPSQLEHAIAALEAQRALLGDAVVDASQQALRDKLAALRQEPPAEQRKQATILFADVSGFTALSELLDAEEVRDRINALWSRLDAIITAHGGTIDKHIGDAVMALWGADAAREDDPERAVRAALAMQQALARLRDAGLALAMRIGINTGPVLLGSVGTTGEYTAIGDAVNLAARLEQAAPVGGVLIAHDTYRHVRGLFTVAPLAPLLVKGKAEPVQAYLVRALAPRSFRPATRGLEGQETRMVGRQDELSELQQRFATAALERQPQLITVVGEAGLGKSRLLAEFLRWTDDQPAPHVLFQGRATEELQRVPYALLQTMFAFAYQIQEGDSAEVAREKFERGVRAQLGDAEPDARMKAHVLGQLLGLDFAASPALRGILADARQIRDRGLSYLAQLIGACANRGGVLIALEDLHWADDASLDALCTVLPRWAALPVTLIALTRPGLFERAPGWGAELPGQRRLALAALSDAESRQLVAGLLPGAALPEALHALIATAAEGNPFYVEEFVKMLIEEGTIALGPGTCAVNVARLATAAIPPTLTGILQARVDSLSPQERTVLQQASVVGRVFWDQAARYIGDQQERLDALLEQLRQRELIFERQPSTFAGAREYSFKHAMLREVVYESILKRQRRQYHGRAAEWLTRQSGERAEEYAGVIAGHYEQAGAQAQAGAWYERAGRRALASYANQAAIDAFERAAALLPAARRVPLLLALGAALEVVGRWQEALAQFRQALELALSSEDRGAAGRARIAAGGILRRQGSPEEARAMLKAALEDFTTLGDELGQSEALGALSAFYWRQGEVEEGLRTAEESLRLAQASGDSRRVAIARHRLANVLSLGGDHASAAALYEANIAIFDQLGDLSSLSGCFNNLGTIALMGGDLDRARAHIDRGLQLVRILGNTVAIAMSLHNLGNIALAQQDVAARGYYEEALQLTWSAGDQRGIAYNVAGLAAVALREGDPARAARLASAADTLMRKTNGIWEPDERPRYDQTVQEARRLLDEHTFAVAWAAGEALTLDQLLASAQAREER